MKIIFLFIGLALSNTTLSQIPDLAKRTLNGNLYENDFEDRVEFMVNVDTLKWGQETLSGEFSFYHEKKRMLEKLTQVFSVLKDKKIDYFIELKNNLLYHPYKLHWFMIIENYRIDWWFSLTDESKLKSITLVKTS